MPSIGAQVRMQEARQEAVQNRTYSNSLFGPVLDDIVQKIKDLPMYKEHVQAYQSKNRLLRIESRDTMVMPDKLLGSFIKKEAKRNICSETVQQWYVDKAFQKAFKTRTDDWIAVMSTSMDATKQGLWSVEAFLFAGLTSTYHQALAPVWELSLICTGKLSGIGLTLVQGFVYAAKVYTTKYNTQPLVFLDLANGYANTTGLSTYSHVGYSSLSHLLKKEPMHSIINQKISDEKDRSEIVTDASVFMAMDLKNISASDLKSNIGLKTLTAFGPSIDTSLGLAGKIKHAILKARLKLKKREIELPVTDCDTACLSKVDVAIQKAFELAKEFYNINDVESEATFKTNHKDFLLALQNVVHNCTDNLTTYTNLLSSSSSTTPNAVSSSMLASSSGGQASSSLTSSLASFSGVSTHPSLSPSLASSSGGGTHPSSFDSRVVPPTALTPNDDDDSSDDDSLGDDSLGGDASSTESPTGFALLTDDESLDDYYASPPKFESPTESPTNFTLLPDDDSLYDVASSRDDAFAQSPSGDLVWTRSARGL